MNEDVEELQTGSLCLGIYHQAKKKKFLVLMDKKNVCQTNRHWIILFEYG